MHVSGTSKNVGKAETGKDGPSHPCLHHYGGTAAALGAVLLET